MVIKTLDRTILWAAQTPQAYQYPIIKEALEKAGLKPEEAELAMIPKAWVEVSAEDADLNIALIEWLENLDDVDAVYHNMKLPQ